MLRGIWLDPASVDPRLKAAEVTRDIAVRLSRVAEELERTQRQARPDAYDSQLALGIEESSLFLMRVLFCMFAEDVELLPKGSFTLFLKESRSKSHQWWQSGLRDLWQAMNNAEHHNRFWAHGDALVRHFNGNLFSSAKVYDLPQEFKGELSEAAQRDWRAVEPAIFGTLLEQVLTTARRAQLGAHYTPRPYVQRLVSATFGDLLNEQWATVEEAVRKQSGLEPLRQFHTSLCDLRILDPACGTGNFLYVAMEELLRLEDKAIGLAASLGETIAPAIHPNQFLGLELNPRAAVIAELVLWIGWLRHRLANHPSAIGDPVLPTLTNINGGTHGGFDAVLRRTATGEPDTATPMVPDWPVADFIVGNPPFIGGKDIRAKLGGDYAETLWCANPRVPKSADFVMHWWDHAAWLLTRPKARLQRFGFVTTNSITQTFSRRVIEGYLRKSVSSPSTSGGEGDRAEGVVEGTATSKAPPSSKTAASAATSPSQVDGEDARTLSLIFAIADHPWTKATPDAAAVRIAMTVAAAGAHDGRLLEIVREEALETDNPNLVTRAVDGAINADLSLGSDITAVVSLKANEGISFRGVTLIGKGFIVNEAEAKHLGLGKRVGLEGFVRKYRNGRDLLAYSRDSLVLDFFGLGETEVRNRFPEAYQHLLSTVHPFRQGSNRAAYRDRWWIFGEPRGEQRPALVGLERYIATTQTSAHRVFQFLSEDILPDQQVIAIASDEAFLLGQLSSSIHLQWTLHAGGWLGVGNDNRYNNSRVFDPFPFPDATPAQRAAIAELAEELDATRKAALAEVPGLTMTELYNWRDKLRSGAPLSPHEQDRAREARAGIVHRLHEQIDAAVADAYGWRDDWERGDLTPADIVTRLVALNATRAAEEATGEIRWLRPEYQIPRFAR